MRGMTKLVQENPPRVSGSDDSGVMKVGDVADHSAVAELAKDQTRTQVEVGQQLASTTLPSSGSLDLENLPNTLDGHDNNDHDHHHDHDGHSDDLGYKGPRPFRNIANRHQKHRSWPLKRSSLGLFPPFTAKYLTADAHSIDEKHDNGGQTGENDSFSSSPTSVTSTHDDKDIKEQNRHREREFKSNDKQASAWRSLRNNNMDRRRAALNGPRQQQQTPQSQVNVGSGYVDEQRTQAFESIFGRPSAAHHNLGPTNANPYQQQQAPLNYGQSFQQSAQYASPSSQSQYSRPARNTLPSQPPSVQGYQYPAHSYSQSLTSNNPNGAYYHQNGLSPLSATGRSNYAASTNGHASSNRNYPPSSAYASSSNGLAGSATGVIASPPPPPQDPSLDYYLNQGMTPAQAYQAQVFQQRGHLQPAASQLPPRGPSPSAGRTTSLNVMGNGSSSARAPSLNFEFAEDGGRLSLDFSKDDNVDQHVNNGKPSAEDAPHFDKFGEEEGELDSELPWIKTGQRTPTLNWPKRGASQNALIARSIHSSTPPGSVDSHDDAPNPPPKLNIDLGRKGSTQQSQPNHQQPLVPGSPLLPDTPSDTSSTRTSVDSARNVSGPASQGLPTLDINISLSSPNSNASSAPGSALPSASSSVARRSLPNEGTRVRTPLSQLSFSASSIGSTQSQAPTLIQSSGTHRRTTKRAPLVYPALLSRVAEALIQRLPLTIRTKNGLSYPDAFDGQEAVEKICYIIKTSDRSLALLLGRALDAQKFFHDVTYEHRLRDNPSEIYQFRGNWSMATKSNGMFSLKGDMNTPAGSIMGLSSTQSGSVMSHTRSDSRGMSSPVSMSGSSHRPSTSRASIQESLGTYSTASSNTYMPASHHQGTSEHTIQADQAAGSDDLELPIGVFTLLTECYSATCTRDQLCYSVTCPRRLEQLARMNQQRPGSATGHRSSNSVSGHGATSPTKVGRRATIGSGIVPTLTTITNSGRESGPTSPVGSSHGHIPQAASKANDPTADEEDDAIVETGQLWIHSVAKEIVDTLSDAEKKRQEAINEVIYTERDFVKDMEYLRDVWVAGIRNSDVIPIERRDTFISQVFWNLLAIIDVNTKLRDLLSKRQKQYVVIGEIGDIFEEVVPLFEPFVDYGAHQMYGKYEFEKEKSSNPAFAQFVEEIEHLKESRKLELNGYLTKPTTRLARYPLLLEAVLKQTSDNSEDKTTLPKVIQLIRGFLGRVNQKTGEAENRFHLHQLERQLAYRPGEYVDLKLSAETRKLVYKGSLNRTAGAGDKDDLQVFLFDHALLMVKQKTKGEQYKVFRRPIPLEFLVVSGSEEVQQVQTLRPGTTGRVGGRNALVKPSAQSDSHSSTSHHHINIGHVNSTNANSNAITGSNKNGFPITFTHLGWRGNYSITLWAPTYISKKKWLEAIQKQQDEMKERSTVFETVPFAEGFCQDGNRVNCASPFNGGRRIAYGSDDGVYFSDFSDNGRAPIKVLALPEVTQIDILEESQLLVVLSERSVIAFPMEELDPKDPTAALKRGKRIATHTSFFKAGTCIGKSIVCVVKTSPLSTTVKTFEPIDQQVRGRNRPTFKKLLQGGNDTLKLFKEFYIPVESHSLTILKSRLCIGCARGFQIVDLVTLDTQPLVDPADLTLDFIEKKENLRPIAIFRVDAEFLLCYDEWAVFVDKRGFRARNGWQASWEGRPTAFAFHYPYVIAIEPSFVEIWDILTCSIKQVIHGDNLRCLFSEPPPSGTVYSSNVSHIPHSGLPQNYAPYPPRGSSAVPYMQPGMNGGYGRPSLQGHSPGYGQTPVGPYGPMVPGQVAPVVQGYHAFGRREILLASDECIMFLKPATSAPPTAGSAAPPGQPIPANSPYSDARQLPVR